MTTFLIITVIGWIATACLTKILFISIQDGQWLDNLLGWQRRLAEWDKAGKTFYAKAGGYCELCFCHAISFLSFWSYAMVANMAFDTWITESVNGWVWKVLINAVWYLVYIAVATNMSLHFVTRMFKQKD